MADEPHDPSNFGEKVRAVTGLIATADDPRFGSDELVTCVSCTRSNPPNRTICLYCGKPIEAASVRSDAARINYQRPEPWEDGFSLIYSGSSELSNKTKIAAAELLQMDINVIEKVLSAQIQAPLIYLRSLADAGLLGARLSNIGFDCAIVGDDLLQAKVPPTRVRQIYFEDSRSILKDFNTGKETAVQKDQRVLIVVGNIVKTSFEKNSKLSKRTMKTMDESQAVSEELFADIYPPSEVYGFRIRSSGFDFSCLGEQMSPIAAENMVELIDQLRNWFTAAKFVDAFRIVSPLLNSIWPPDEIRQSSQVSRGPLGGVRKQSVMVLDNTIQFTKFSRLQRHFL